MDEKPCTIHLWSRPTSQRTKPSKDVLIAEINKQAGQVIELSGLTIKDLQLVIKALGVTTTEFQDCKTKADYVSAFGVVVPQGKTFHRLGLPALRALSEVFICKTNPN